jgi:hypothetical protein
MRLDFVAGKMAAIAQRKTRETAENEQLRELEAAPAQRERKLQI